MQFCTRPTLLILALVAGLMASAVPSTADAAGAALARSGAALSRAFANPIAGTFANARDLLDERRLTAITHQRNPERLLEADPCAHLVIKGLGRRGEAFVLREKEGWEILDIAAYMNIESETVDGYVKAGRRAIRKRCLDAEARRAVFELYDRDIRVIELFDGGKGLSQRRIAEQEELTRAVVRGILKKHDAQRAPGFTP